jgi:hypothetical protein
MSKQIYEKAKIETLTKLGLTDFCYFEDEFDMVLSQDTGAMRRPNNMNDDTAFLLDTTNFEDKTEYG